MNYQLLLFELSVVVVIVVVVVGQTESPHLALIGSRQVGMMLLLLSELSVVVVVVVVVVV